MNNINIQNTLDYDQSNSNVLRILIARYFLVYFSKSDVSFFLFITQVD